jgi:SAM-dependent methyltransferase
MLYYSSDPQALLLKFSRLLRPNGIIVISIYQKRNSWRARLKFKMNNARCTRIVKAFIARAHWTVEQDQEIEQLNKEPWWLLVTRPS